MEILGPEAGELRYGPQRYLRDVVALCIGGGTTEIQKNIVAKTMGLA